MACQAIAQTIAENGADLQELLTRKQGKPLKGLGSEFELGGCIAMNHIAREEGNWRGAEEYQPDEMKSNGMAPLT